MNAMRKCNLHKSRILENPQMRLNEGLFAAFILHRIAPERLHSRYAA